MPEISEEDFLKCYDEYADAIYRHCFFRVFSKPLAEELMQETFLRTWEYLGSGKQVDNLRAFLYRVATNLVIDHSRKKKEEPLEPLLENAPGLEPALDGAREMERNALAAEVIRAIRDLPEAERQIITLRYVDELEPREIASIMDITPNHVSVKLNRAMKILRKYLNDTEE